MSFDTKTNSSAKPFLTVIIVAICDKEVRETCAPHTQCVLVTLSDHSLEHLERDITQQDADRQKSEHVVCGTSQRHRASHSRKRGPPKRVLAAASQP